MNFVLHVWQPCIGNLRLLLKRKKIYNYKHSQHKIILFPLPFLKKEYTMVTCICLPPFSVIFHLHNDNTVVDKTDVSKCYQMRAYIGYL
jgi:hypothetical protein